MKYVLVCLQPIPEVAKGTFTILERRITFRKELSISVRWTKYLNTWVSTIKLINMDYFQFDIAIWNYKDKRGRDKSNVCSN